MKKKASKKDPGAISKGWGLLEFLKLVSFLAFFAHAPKKSQDFKGKGGGREDLIIFHI